MYTVIVVDDEDDLRRGLIRKIEWETIGFRVIGEAENGIEALELVEKLEPDLLLSDVKMPFMSGIELARQVREIRPTMQIAFLSGYDDFTYAQQAIQYNIVSYMLKPITSEDLTKELYKIKTIIDDKFEAFTSSTQIQEQVEITNFMMPLVLDSFLEQEDEDMNRRLVEDAVSCGFLHDVNVNLHYIVMVTSFWNKDGKNCTVKENVNAVDTILKKYVRYTSFFVGNRIVSILVATKRDLDKYLHILVEDITQSTRRIMRLDANIGIGRKITKLQQCHEGYKEAMTAIAQCDRDDVFVRYITDIQQEDSIKKKSGSDICDQALELIDKQFDCTDISLVSISTEIAVSPNYLSMLIKKSTGSTFIDLLTKKRIETAKEMLENSPMKIKEITERCGYSDQHYFSYSFKKVMGVSPNVYRRQYEEGTQK